MVNIEELRTRGLWAYEAGRLRFASRIALVLAPVAAVCLIEARGREACACLAVALILVSIVLRWRSRLGADSVAIGLLAGGLPLLFGLALARLGVDCTSSGLAPYCFTASVCVGAAAGVWVGIQEAQRRDRFWSWVAAGFIAVLSASCGCIRLGVASVVGVTLGVALGVIVVAALRRPRRG